MSANNGSEVKTYDPNSIYVIVGVFPIGGFADGTAIEARRAEQTYKKVSGINGLISRRRSFDKSGEITFTLAQTSLSNLTLSAIMLADEYTGNGVIPLVIYDIDTQSVVLSAFGWLRKPPDVTYGKDLSNRQWVFEAADIDIIPSGNLDTK